MDSKDNKELPPDNETTAEKDKSPQASPEPSSNSSVPKGATLNISKKYEPYSRPILAPSRLGSGFPSTGSSGGGSFLRSPQSSTNRFMCSTNNGTASSQSGQLTFPPPLNPAKPFKLKPSVLSASTTSGGVSSATTSNNPFAKVPDDQDLSLSPKSSDHSISSPKLDVEAKDISSSDSASPSKANDQTEGSPEKQSESRLGPVIDSESESPVFSSESSIDAAKSDVTSSTSGKNSEEKSSEVSADSPCVDTHISSSVFLRPSVLTSPSNNSSNSLSPSANARPIFVPLSSGTEPSSSDDSRVNGLPSPSLTNRVSNTGFIFGTNLENRRSGFGENNATNYHATNGDGGGGGITENLFSEAAAVNSFGGSSEEGAVGGSTKSLVESSREVTEKEASLKRKYDEVEVVTGEEEESNVLQMVCKLYWFINGTYQERGRGILRLNDREIFGSIHSRLVIRTQGTLTVMLNAKVWADMCVENPNPKSVRFTVLDSDGQPKIYLIMGSPKDVSLLHSSLEYRIRSQEDMLKRDKKVKN